MLVSNTNHSWAVTSISLRKISNKKFAAKHDKNMDKRQEDTKTTSYCTHFHTIRYNHYQPYLLTSSPAKYNIFIENKIESVSIVFISLQSIGMVVPWWVTSGTMYINQLWLYLVQGTVVTENGKFPVWM